MLLPFFPTFKLSFLVLVYFHLEILFFMMSIRIYEFFLSFFIGSHTTFIRLIFLLACYPLITPLFSFFTPVTSSLMRYASFFPILSLPLSHTLILCLLKDLPPYFPFILSLYPCTSQHYPLLYSCPLVLDSGKN